ncbi:predicted protein [Naegleria gruberi]|uniref:Predicted protein n=1 Tax=Naegleria gruberi TaxID=5762 RepID=D2VPT0_NAEGR|nr:uncharacterized protein NAEGRDRAFT_70973 [Naegleria gruberi]EFC41258.1 predicted protein [Naegleria gruberi]|eukprot:XP_002674002.1 predicted protein [Naegleria gruberi strain NEG-M]
MRNRLSKINPQTKVEAKSIEEEKKEVTPIVNIAPGVIPPPPVMLSISNDILHSESLSTGSNTPSPPNILICEEKQIPISENLKEDKEEPLLEEIEEDELVEEVLSPSSIIIPSIIENQSPSTLRADTTPTNQTLPKLQSTNRLSLSITNNRRSICNNDNFMEETLTDLRLTEKLIDDAIQQVTLSITKENVKSHLDCLMTEKVPLALDRILSNIMKANDYLTVRFDEIGEVLNDIGEQCNIISKEPQMEKRFYMNSNNKNRGSKMMEPEVPFRKKSTINLQSTDFSSEEHRQIFSRVAQMDLSFPSYYQVLKNVGTPLEFDETELYTISNSDAVSTNHDSALYSPNYHSQQQKRKSSNSTPYMNSGSLTARSSRSLSSESSKNSYTSFNTPSESPVTVGLYNTQQ